jgi:hypothetical protein
LLNGSIRSSGFLLGMICFTRLSSKRVSRGVLDNKATGKTI